MELKSMEISSNTHQIVIEIKKALVFVSMRIWIHLILRKDLILRRRRNGSVNHWQRLMPAFSLSKLHNKNIMHLLTECKVHTRTYLFHAFGAYALNFTTNISPID